MPKPTCMQAQAAWHDSEIHKSTGRPKHSRRDGRSGAQMKERAPWQLASSACHTSVVWVAARGQPGRQRR
jgi:hypothetical protein